MILTSGKKWAARDGDIGMCFLISLRRRTTQMRNSSSLVLHQFCHVLIAFLNNNNNFYSAISAVSKLSI